MTTPSEQLRTAAETLRTMAEAATPGPWVQDGDRPDIVMKPDRPGFGWDGTAITSVQPDEFGLTEPGDAALIALMDPTLALMLAIWLEATAMEWPRISKRDVPMPKKALALAEHINGRTHG